VLYFVNFSSPAHRSFWLQLLSHLPFLLILRARGSFSRVELVLTSVFFFFFFPTSPFSWPVGWLSYCRFVKSDRPSCGHESWTSVQRRSGLGHESSPISPLFCYLLFSSSLCALALIASCMSENPVFSRRSCPPAALENNPLTSGPRLFLFRSPFFRSFLLFCFVFGGSRSWNRTAAWVFLMAFTAQPVFHYAPAG